MVKVANSDSIEVHEVYVKDLIRDRDKGLRESVVKLTVEVWNFRMLGTLKLEEDYYKMVEYKTVGDFYKYSDYKVSGMDIEGEEGDVIVKKGGLYSHLGMGVITYPIGKLSREGFAVIGEDIDNPPNNKEIKIYEKLEDWIEETIK